MPRSSRSHAPKSLQAYTLETLRTTARKILLEDGTALAPTMQTPEDADDVVDDLANALSPTFKRDRAALLDEVADPDLARRLSDHGGGIMAAYGTAGYFVGLAMGLELAALTACGSVHAGARRTRKGRVR